MISSILVVLQIVSVRVGGTSIPRPTSHSTDTSTPTHEDIWCALLKPATEGINLSSYKSRGASVFAGELRVLMPSHTLIPGLRSKPA